MGYPAVTAFLDGNGGMTDPRSPELKAEAVLRQADRDGTDLRELLRGVLIEAFKLEALQHVPTDQPQRDQE